LMAATASRWVLLPCMLLWSACWRRYSTNWPGTIHCGRACQRSSRCVPTVSCTPLRRVSRVAGNGVAVLAGVFSGWSTRIVWVGEVVGVRHVVRSSPTLRLGSAFCGWCGFLACWSGGAWVVGLGRRWTAGALFRPPHLLSRWRVYLCG
jgi:hypothetical protein